MRIVFMGSPVFAVPSLQKLIRDRYDVAAVYTQPDRPAGRGRKTAQPPVKQLASQYGIPVEQPETLKSDAVLERLRSWQPDAIVICAYGQILTQAVLDIPPMQCLNVHFSLLPRHRGATPAAAAILEGDDFTGVSVQLVRLKLDTGPVLSSATIPIMPQDTTLSLAQKLSYVGAGLISETLCGWLRNERVPVIQEETRSNYIKQITKDQGRIDWNLPALSLWRQVRAYSPWPGSCTTWKQRRLKITRAEPVEQEGKEASVKIPTGTVLEMDAGFGVQTGDGILRILELQPEGRKKMSAVDFLRGHRDIIGAVLPG